MTSDRKPAHRAEVFQNATTRRYGWRCADCPATALFGRFTAGGHVAALAGSLDHEKDPS